MPLFRGSERDRTGVLPAYAAAKAPPAPSSHVPPPSSAPPPDVATPDPYELAGVRDWAGGPELAKCPDLDFDRLESLGGPWNEILWEAEHS